MIFAAGFGTRLGPLTENKPKALVEINGTPILELLIMRMIKFGLKDIIINVHHFAEQIISFLENKNHFNINIKISQETNILGTGGGLKKAGLFFDDNSPFLVHNVDILTNFTYENLIKHHKEQKNLATLVLMERETSRYFIVDKNDQICGHGNDDIHLIRTMKSPCYMNNKMAFSGIHMISPKIFDLIKEEGKFSIVNLYLRLIAEGHRIGAYHMPACYWKDLGTKKHIQAAESDISKGIFSSKNDEL